MTRIREIIREIHRRSIWQVLGIYLVGSWIGYQVILGLADGLGLPDWVPGFSVVLFIIGLPIVLATAFVQEGALERREAASAADRATVAVAADRDVAAGEAERTKAAAAPAGALASTGAPTPAPAPGTRLSWLTWRRSLVGGVVAFGILALLAAGYMALRAAGIGPFGSLMAAGKLEDQARILIADFRSPGGDTALASLVTEAFRIDLARSTAARLVEPRDVREVLRRMGRDEVPRLDEETAREIAMREGIDAYITGDVTQAAAGYVLGVRLIATATDEVLVALREAASGSDELIPAIDRLSRALRTRTGESLRTIRRAQPLAKVTTSSLAALQKYTEGHRASGWLGDPARSLQLHEEAVALDSTFAAAHFAIAVHYFNGGQPEAAIASIENSLRWQDRLTEAQRHGARAMYHNLKREYAQAAAEYEQALAVDPQNYAAQNNLGLAHARMGDHERAAHYYRRAIALDTARFFGYVNLGESLVMLGRFEPARDTFAQAVRLAPASAWALVNEALVDYPAGNYEQAEKKLRALFDDDDANTAVRQRAGSRLFLLLGARGRFAESQRLRRSLAEARGGPDEADQQVLRTQFFYELFVLKDKERARSTLQRVRSSFDAAAETDSSALHSMAEACAWLGDLACARDYLKRTGFAGEPQPWTTTDTYFALGAIALAEGNVEAAVRYFRGGSDTNCPSCEEAVVGHVFEQVGQPDSALAAYERYLATPSMDRVWADAFGLGSALYSVAQLHEARGDRKRAASAYADLLRLWQDADAELQPIVQDARNRLARLQPDG